MPHSRPLSSDQIGHLRPRVFPSDGFAVIDSTERVEEEQLPYYQRKDYYPMRIGDVIREHYQVVAKLGYGTSSTVWLARDLREQTPTYYTLKVHINTLKQNHELEVFRHLASFAAKNGRSDEDTNHSDHPGRKHVRELKDMFQLTGPDGEHDVFVMTPLGMSLRTFQEMQKTGTFQPALVTSAVSQALLGLAYLHDADVVHTDLHSDNLLIALTLDNILAKVEDNELTNPSPRKVDGDRVFYVSQYLLGGAGPLTICDLGQARIGREHVGMAMPLQYRAPEVILGMPWGPSVDIWSIALLAWDLVDKQPLFSFYDPNSPELNDAHHLAAMTALLGPPPPAFLQRSPSTTRYWDAQGQWKGPVPLPPETELDTVLTGIDKQLFLTFLDSLLCWLPEERPSALEALSQPWLCFKPAEKEKE